jgi:hypothetical protein
MVGPVYGENAVYAHFSLFLGSHVPIDAIRTKHNVRVAVALQNLLLHLPVTHCTAAVATPGIHYDFAGELA